MVIGKQVTLSFLFVPLTWLQATPVLASSLDLHEALEQHDMIQGKVRRRLFGTVNLGDPPVGQELLGGRFETTTRVDGLLNLGSELAAINNSTQEEGERTYRAGGTAFYLSKDGTSQNISLSTLSTLTIRQMNDDPFFLLYRHSFESWGSQNGEEEGLFMGRNSDEYADAIISDLFRRDIANIPTEAILVLNMWMAVVHELFNALRECRSGYDAKASIQALDRAVALWVGNAGQGDEMNLYGLTEIAGERFGQKAVSTGETLGNTRILNRFSSIQSSLSNEINCSVDSRADVLRNEIYTTINLMTVPLIQNLIHYVLTGENGEFTRVYLSAVMPQILTCDPSLAAELRIDQIESITDSQKGFWIEVMQSAFSCFRLSCEDIGAHEKIPVDSKCQDETLATFAGYDAFSVDSKPFSRIDRDLVKLKIFLEEGSIDSFRDVYQHGYHGPFSYQRLARNEVISKNAESSFDIFNAYYNGESYDFIDREIHRLLEKRRPYETISDEKITEIIIGLLSYETMYLSISSALKGAEENCLLQTIDSKEAAKKQWDMAAAFYIGSIEGSQPGGRAHGLLLHGSSKRLCNSFNTCSDSDSRANVVILDSFIEGKSHLENNDCTNLQRIAEEAIHPALQVTLVQGTIAYAAILNTVNSDTDGKSIGIAHAFARAILPEVNQASRSSSNVLKQNLIIGADKNSGTNELSKITGAFQLAIPNMTFLCTDVGILQSPLIDLCQSASQPFLTNTISFGRYEFLFHDLAEEYAALSYDVRNMVQADTIEEAKRIYEGDENPPHSSYYEENLPFTLASFSTDAASFMSEDPMFNIFKYALYDDAIFDSTSGDLFAYADKRVQDYLSMERNDLAAESAVVLNTWMMIVHELYSTINACKEQENALLHVDSAVALWLGKEQSEEASDGWMMYSIAQLASEEFGHEESESSINAQLMHEFTELQEMTKACEFDKEKFLEVRMQVDSIIRLLSIPLIQRLLVAMADNNVPKVELYAAAVIPQCAGCNPRAHERLREALNSGYSGGFLDIDIIKNLSILLRCMRVSSTDLRMTQKASATLMTLVSQISTEIDNTDKSSFAFDQSDLISSPKLDEISRIDLDVLQIGIFMKTKAYGTALTYYNHGHNAYRNRSLHSTRTKSSLLSLHDIATFQSQMPLESLDFLAKYYGTDAHSDALMSQVLERSGPFRAATRKQLAEVASAVLESMVSYMGTAWNFHGSVSTCLEGRIEESSELWRTAVALYIGSIGLAGDSRSNGLLLHSVGVEQCVQFGTCTASGDAFSNELLMRQIVGGWALLQAQECPQLQRFVENTIMPLLQVPLIQGTLSNSLSQQSDTIENSSNSAYGYVYAQSILPMVAESNNESAESIANIFSSPFQPVESIAQTSIIFNAFKDSVAGMNVDCSLIGQLAGSEDYSVCQAYNIPETVREGYFAGLDVAAMADALRERRNSLAQVIYTGGQNRLVNDESGTMSFMVVNGESGTMSLQMLSTESTLDMLDEPLFNLHLNTATKTTRGGNYNSERHQYADDFVQAFITMEDGSSTLVAAEAVVALSVWMHMAHLLQDAVSGCEAGRGGQEVSEILHRAASYWIGDANVGVEGEPGHLLYDLANKMEDHFEISDETQSGVNDDILALFAEAQRLSTTEGACSVGSDDAFQLHVATNQITLLMTVPLVQGLIHALKMQDRNRVKLYAHALVPMFSSCTPATYEYLRTFLYENAYNVVDTDAIVEAIYEMLPCLGLQCNQVGVHSLDASDVQRRFLCYATNEEAYNGYKPFNEAKYGEMAHLDIDLREIEILMEMGAYGAATRVFRYGRHTNTSLGVLASETSFEVLPHYQAYSGFYASETYNYQLVLAALSGSDKRLTTTDRRVAAVRFCQMILFPQLALVQLHNSVAFCRMEGDYEHQEVMASWDHAASLLLGSFDHEKLSEQDSWHTPYALGQEFCAEFGTCQDGGVSSANQRLVELLYAGRGAASGGTCGALEKQSEEIAALLLVPVVQATLSAAEAVSDANTATNQARAEAFVFSRVLAPLVDELDASDATRLQGLLPESTAGTGKAHPHTGRAVASLLSGLYGELGVDCGELGSLPGGEDPCAGTPATATPTVEAWLWPVLAAGLVAIAAVVAASAWGLGGVKPPDGCCWPAIGLCPKRNKKRKKKKRRSRAALLGHDDEEDDEESSLVHGGTTRTNLSAFGGGSGGSSLGGMLAKWIAPRRAPDPLHEIFEGSSTSLQHFHDEDGSTDDEDDDYSGLEEEARLVMLSRKYVLSSRRLDEEDDRASSGSDDEEEDEENHDDIDIDDQSEYDSEYDDDEDDDDEDDDFEDEAGSDTEDDETEAESIPTKSSSRRRTSQSILAEVDIL